MFLRRHASSVRHTGVTTFSAFGFAKYRGLMSSDKEVHRDVLNRYGPGGKIGAFTFTTVCAKSTWPEGGTMSIL